MAKEPRFWRRALAEQMTGAIRNFPESAQPLMRNLSFMPSFYEAKGYVFLQLKVEGITDYDNEYRPKRQAMLEIACGAARNKFENLNTVVGIAIDAPKFTSRNSEDFILMDCSQWPDHLREHYEKANEDLGFFQSDQLVIQQKTVTEFPIVKENKAKANALASRKVGRNDPCPRGSRKKYKKCCIDISGE